jgi:hypothetical protein
MDPTSAGATTDPVMFPSNVKRRWASPSGDLGNANSTNHTLPLAKITGMPNLASTNMSSLKKSIYNPRQAGIETTSGTFSPKGSLF